MNKKYIVRLTDEERADLRSDGQGARTGKSEKLRRAVILLKADVDGPGWKDEKISEAVGCRIQTVENVRTGSVRAGRLRGCPGAQETGDASHARSCWTEPPKQS